MFTATELKKSSDVDLNLMSSVELKKLAARAERTARISEINHPPEETALLAGIEVVYLGKNNVKGFSGEVTFVYKSSSWFARGVSPRVEGDGSVFGSAYIEFYKISNKRRVV